MRKQSSGFTIIELLVVIVIIALLIALLMPAVQAARESARALKCKNNLKQLSLGLVQFHDQRGHFPSSGWGWKWPPYPELDFQDRQPGSWAYSILPYIEQPALHGPRVDNTVRLATTVELFYCPSRRNAGLYEMTNPDVFAPKVQFVCKSDYAACAGDHDDPNSAGPAAAFYQPDTLAEGLDPRWWESRGVIRDATGIIFQRSMINLADVKDGTAHTYLVGEKLLDPLHYISGAGLGDLESVFHGADDDTSRVVWPGYGPPRQDTPGYQNRNLFGSAHPVSCQFAFADGSVRRVSYTIDVETHRRLGNRKDRLPLGEIP